MEPLLVLLFFRFHPIAAQSAFRLLLLCRRPLSRHLLHPLQTHHHAISVYDYCEAAARHLKPGSGRFVFVMLAQDPRTEDAPRKNGLKIVERWDYTFVGGRKPHIATIVCALPESGSESNLPRQNGHMLIRDGKSGEFTDEHVEFKQFMLADSRA